MRLSVMVFNQYHKNLLVSQLEAALTAAKNMPVTISCHTCANYDISGAGPGRCRAADVLIPPEVVDVGCEAYILDWTIPPF